MTYKDLIILIKKILVGIIVTTIPFFILFGGLRFVQRILTTKDKAATSYETKLK